MVIHRATNTGKARALHVGVFINIVQQNCEKILVVLSGIEFRGLEFRDSSLQKFKNNRHAQDFEHVTRRTSGQALWSGQRLDL